MESTDRGGIDGFQPSAAAYHNSTVFAGQVRSVPVTVFHREPGPGGAYASNGEFWRQPGPIDVVLVAVGLQLPDGEIPVHEHDNYFYSALQLRPGARRGVVLAALLPGGVDVVYDGYGYHAWQPRPGAERGVGVVFLNSGNSAQQTVLGIERANGMAGALRNPNLGSGYDGSGALADGLGVVHDNPGMVAQHLRRLVPFVGIGASSVAVNGLAAGPGSPAVGLHLLVLLLGGLFLVILHVLRV